MLKHARPILVIAAAAGLATPALAQTASEYVKKAGASDLFEITEGKLMATSADPQVKTFAQQMVTDHTKSTQMVKQAAMSDGMRPAAPMLDADQKKMVAALRAAHGKARDALYVTQQKTAHQMALRLTQGFAASAPASASHLKAAATKIAPIVQHHIDELNSMPTA